MSQRRSFLRFSILTPIWTRFTFACGEQPRSSVTELTVLGDVPTPLTLRAEDLAKMPRGTVSIPELDGIKVHYEGVPLREVLLRAGAPLGNQLRGKALASYVRARANDGYEVVFALAELDSAIGNRKIIVADKRDGKLLPGNQGPFRLVCPDDKGRARSVRTLERIEVVQLQT